MAAFTDETKKRLLNTLLGNGTPNGWVTPSSYYIGLLNAGVEISGSGYTRLAIANNATNFPLAAVDATYGYKKTYAGAPSSFPTATAPWNSGAAISNFGIWDQATGGNMLFTGTLTAPVIAGTSDTLRIVSGDLLIAFADLPAFTNELERRLLNMMFGSGFSTNDTFVRPSSYNIALITTAPSVDTGGTEITGSGYARVAVTNNSTNFPDAAVDATYGYKKTFLGATPITFTTATGDWNASNPIPAVEIWGDQFVGGLATTTKLMAAALTNQVTIPNGDTLRIVSGDFEVYFTN